MKNTNAIVAAKVATLVAAGSTPVEALRIVCGADVVDAMISNLYDTLRASKVAQ